MPKVKGKKPLCSCEKKYFKSLQGFGEHSLFDRFSDIENTVRKKIDENYQHFLAQPVIEEGETIFWFSHPYKETPQRLTEMQGEIRIQYEQIKTETTTHFETVIKQLEHEGETRKAESLEKAIKFVNDDFVYCYDGKTILGIWGMQLRDEIRESIGIAMKTQFVPKKNKEEEKPDSVPLSEEEDFIKNPLINSFSIVFKTGEEGRILGNYELTKYENELINQSEIPEVQAKNGYEFMGWDKSPKNFIITEDTVFRAQYREIPLTIAKVPWYRRFWSWFIASWLRWLLWLFLLLLLLFLFSWLYRSCCDLRPEQVLPPSLIDKPENVQDPNLGKGGIYNRKEPYEPEPTPLEYHDLLPPEVGVLEPVDSTEIIREPGKPVIIGNRLNILMENKDKSIIDLAKDFKAKFPDNTYKVIYYDDVVKRMQIKLPKEERENLKQTIPGLFEPKYELFVFDETLFENRHIPNDPAFNDPDKSWYFKAINAPKAWDLTLGVSDITIAIVDNGFSLRHPEFSNKIVMPYNVWTHSKDVFAQTVDHGTHVAGIALATIDNGKGNCGVAPNSRFMPVQVANSQNIMTTTSILDGVLYALYQGADVINISLNTEFEGRLPEAKQQDLQNNHFKEEERLWKEIMKIANEHKAVIVIAAGNDNMLAGIDPMNRPKDFITVSAVDKNLQKIHRAGFSNYGDFSTVSAPGVDIFSTVGSDKYTVMNGTSMAAPIVSGAVALIKSLNRNITAEEVICVIQSTGKVSDGEIGNMVQLDKALQAIQANDLKNCESQPEIPSTGDVQILLSWDNYNDLDLHCVDPNGDKIWYKNKTVSSGGLLEIDMNAETSHSMTPIENIYWPTHSAPHGSYSIYLNFFKKKATNIKENPYSITVKYGDSTKVLNGTIVEEGELRHIFTFSLGISNNEDFPENLSQPLAHEDFEELERKREELQQQLEKINRQLLRRQGQGEKIN
ncbi:S8 family serine peptidase [Flavivirga jejuensis]|uniref:S8 family serine peptidase n=1 Tax=Flavivirga jejuensis TaxID=870487 RepID=A0ABT8WUV5_9FLAO|nr:S8 family serine peptidase [Flavivirga jejuensis]MDO5976924.1 S8 family serine peptidase [Flavivirga jejuensis]